uniref:DNA polymerase alpha subunit B n=1 Tax=Tetranychus urticae TaxID=32264 RepID=T1KRR8_TETUR
MLNGYHTQTKTPEIHQSRIKATHHSATKAKYIPKIKPKIEYDILETYVSLGNIKKENGSEDAKTDLEEKSGESKSEPVKIKTEPVDEPMHEDISIDHIENGKAEINTEKFQARYIKIERSDEPENLVESKREFKVDEDDELYKREVICEFGQVIPFKAWLALKKDRKLNITPFDHNRNLLAEEKFMDCSIMKNVRAMDAIHNELRPLFLSADRDRVISTFVNAEPGEAAFFGKLRMDAKDEFDEKLVFLHDDSECKVRFQLDLTHVKDFSIFPGQFVEIVGEAVTKEIIRVQEIHDMSYLIRPFPPAPTFTHPINIVTASGPFNTPNTDDFSLLKNLLEYVSSYRPDVLILFGPIVEMTSIVETGTRVIVISSPKEWHTLPLFPTPPYNGFWTNIELYPCPSVIDINGLIIGLSSVDIIFHLTKHLLESRKTTESGNRIKRILRHIVAQHNFYPLYPTADEVTLEVPKIEYCRFMKTPHIIILPSTLRNFIHSIEGCVFVNPERIRKNTIGRIQVFPAANQGVSTSIESSISAQIIKL